MSDVKLNKKYIYYNLQEAQEEIEMILKAIKEDGYSHEDYYKSIQHLIHHVNIAWNARAASIDLTENPSDDEMKEWSEYPKDISLI